MLSTAEILGMELPASEPPAAPAPANDQRVDFDHLVDLTATPRILRGSSFPAPPPVPFEEMGQPFLAPPKPRFSPAVRRAGYLTALAVGAGLSWMAISPGTGTPGTASEPIAAAAPAAVQTAAAVAPAAPEARAIEAAPEAAVIPEATEVVVEDVVAETPAVAATESNVTVERRSTTVGNSAPVAAPATTTDEEAVSETEIETVSETEPGTAVTEASAPAALAAASPRPEHIPASDRALAVTTEAEHGSVLHAVDEAFGGGTAETNETTEVEAAAETGPSVSRADVSAAMNGIRGDVEACATGRHGQANVQMMVHSSGRVRGVRVVGTFAGTTEGSCIARAVRGARFPSFEGADFAVHFPFRL